MSDDTCCFCGRRKERAFLSASRFSDKLHCLSCYLERARSEESEQVEGET